jgi:hypothetical protein
MPETIYLRVGTQDEIALSVFIEALQNFLHALRDVDATLSQNTAGSLIWNVVRLEKNSPPLVGVAAHQKPSFARGGHPDLSRKVESELIENARRLSTTGERSELLSDAALKRLENLAKKTPSIGPMAIFQSDNGPSTPKNETQITPQTFENVKRLTSVRYSAYGSIKGSLDAISVHHAYEFRVWDEKTHKPVTCKFSPDEIDNVKALLKSRVTVIGMLTSNSAGNPISISAEDILPTPKRQLPTITEMSGLVKDFTDGKSLKEYMEELSDE